MSNIVQAGSPVQLLAVVPELVGFAPRNSLVLVVFCGSRTCAAYRVDLPEPSSDVVCKRLATTLIGMLCRIRGADGVVPVVYTDDAFAECGGIPRETFATHLVARARTGGFRVLDALCVGSDGWDSYLDAGSGGARALEELEAAVDARRSDPGALPVLAAPERQVRLPRCKQVERDRTASAYAELARVCLTGEVGRDSDLPVEIEPLADPVWLAELSIGWDAAHLTAVQAALVAFAIRAPAVRDVVMLSWGWGPEIGRRAAEFDERWRTGAAVDPEDDVALAIGGMGGLPVPDPARLDCAVQLLRHVAARLPDGLRAPALTMLAWLNWARGRGSVAGNYLERARRIDPGYSLAELLDRLLWQGMLPEWLYARDARDAAVNT
jgi:hypothetical protein